MSQKELIKRLGIPPRTVRYALDKLLELGLIHKRPNLLDMRSIYYSLNLNDQKSAEYIENVLAHHVVPEQLIAA